jgi:excisionase family DNA binding protein
METTHLKRNLRIYEVMNFLSCSRSTIYRLIADGEIIAFKNRGSLLVVTESLEDYRTRQILKFQEENAIESMSGCVRVSLPDSTES